MHGFRLRFPKGRWFGSHLICRSSGGPCVHVASTLLVAICSFDLHGHSNERYVHVHSAWLHAICPSVYVYTYTHTCTIHIHSHLHNTRAPLHMHPCTCPSTHAQIRVVVPISRHAHRSARPAPAVHATCCASRPFQRACAHGASAGQHRPI